MPGICRYSERQFSLPPKTPTSSRANFIVFGQKRRRRRRANCKACLAPGERTWTLLLMIAFLPFSARPGRKHLFGVEGRYWDGTDVKCEMDLLGLWFYFWHKGLRVATLAYKAEALELQKQLRHIQSQFDMHTGQASSLIQGSYCNIYCQWTPYRSR